MSSLTATSVPFFYDEEYRTAFKPHSLDLLQGVGLFNEKTGEFVGVLNDWVSKLLDLTSYDSFRKCSDHIVVSIPFVSSSAMSAPEEFDEFDELVKADTIEVELNLMMQSVMIDEMAFRTSGGNDSVIVREILKRRAKHIPLYYNTFLDAISHSRVVHWYCFTATPDHLEHLFDADYYIPA